jgi:hypothetical protein
MNIQTPKEERIGSSAGATGIGVYRAKEEEEEVGRMFFSIKLHGARFASISEY